MNTTDAFILAGKIGFHYQKKSVHSTAINTEIAQALGIVGYSKFCEEISQPEYRKNPKNNKDYFVVSFVQNIVVDEDCVSDSEIADNYSFESIMNILAKVTS